MIPLHRATLCPQCETITANHACPHCHSQTLPLKPIMNRKPSETIVNWMRKILEA